MWTKFVACLHMLENVKKIWFSALFVIKTRWIGIIKILSYLLSNISVTTCHGYLEANLSPMTWFCRWKQLFSEKKLSCPSVFNIKANQNKYHRFLCGTSINEIPPRGTLTFLALRNDGGKKNEKRFCLALLETSCMILFPFTSSISLPFFIFLEFSLLLKMSIFFNKYIKSCSSCPASESPGNLSCHGCTFSTFGSSISISVLLLKEERVTVKWGTMVQDGTLSVRRRENADYSLETNFFPKMLHLQFDGSF